MSLSLEMLSTNAKGNAQLIYKKNSSDFTRSLFVRQRNGTRLEKKRDKLVGENLQLLDSTQEIQYGHRSV